MRVGMVAPVWVKVPPDGYGGVEWIVHWLVEGMVARGHDVTVVASGDSTTPATRLVTTYAEAPTERMGEPLPEYVHALDAYEALSECDVVHDHTLAGPMIGSLRHGAGRRRSTGDAYEATAPAPVLHTVHGPVDAEMVGYLGRLRHVHLVAISDAQRVAAPRLPWSATIHNAIDVGRFPFREDKDGYLAFLGRFNPDKGVVLAVHLARALGMPLRIAAKMNEPRERDYFEAHVRPLLGDGVEYLGELDTEDKKDLLARAEALAFPIQWEEPFGLVLIEAMACGTPVLAIGRGSVPEVVTDGVTGVVAPDLPSLVEGARHGLARLDGRACREDVEKRFDVGRLVDEYEAVYARVLRGDAEPPTRVATSAP